MKAKTTKRAIFYRSNGKWVPYRNYLSGTPRTFTSTRELSRFLNSWQFKDMKNNVLKSRVTVRKIAS